MTATPPMRWRVFADTGGTFTDCIAIAPSGAVRQCKVLSTGVLRGTIIARDRPDVLRVRIDGLVDGFCGGMRVSRPGDASGPTIEIRRHDADGRLHLAANVPISWTVGDTVEIGGDEPAPILGARRLLGTSYGDPLPPFDLRLATTRGTNALLERTGAPVAAFVTRGFADLLRIGTQQRPDLFDWRRRRPPPLTETMIEVPEALAADGAVREAIDIESVRGAADAAREAGCRVAAVSLKHADLNPAHEERLAAALATWGFDTVVRSSDVAPFVGYLARTETTVVEAYLRPIIDDYLDDVRLRMGEGRLHVMTSAGGLVGASRFRATESLLSGPAAGVGGAIAAARRAQTTPLIGFDMGGTSTDVARSDGAFDYAFDRAVAGVRVLAPSLAIETVAAGGGSICELAHGRLRVGPRSAGARPGPACYGMGGPLTLTDVNLLLGRLDPRRFSIPVSIDRARAAFERVFAAVVAESADVPTRDAVLMGLRRIADETMAEAISRVSIRRGFDPADHTLVSFGGASGQHACAVASSVGVRRVLLPQRASVLSAIGLAHATIERFAERQILRPLCDATATLADVVASLESDAIRGVRDEADGDARVIRRLAHLRLTGQDATLDVDFETVDDLEPRFIAAYRSTYGHPPPARTIELVTVRVVAAESAGPTNAPASGSPPADIEAPSTIPAHFDGAWSDVPSIERESLRSGDVVVGPAILHEAGTSTTVDPGWTATVDADGGVLIVRTDAGATTTVEGGSALVDLELVTSRFRAIAEDMGEVLRRTALSTNVKERLDFSCAVLDADGRLLVNAPHIPVHLGALGICVRAVRDAIEIRPGDVIVTNHPGPGGSHLPDVTVITPVDGADGTRLGYVASRAHHAEIGGTRPGSMPPAARHLAEEGVVIAPMRLVDRGVPRFDAIERLLRNGPFPSRSPEDNLADLAAAVAANHRGAAQFLALAEASGVPSLRASMTMLFDRSSDLAARALAARDGTVCRAATTMDDGTPLAVRLAFDGGRVTIDFDGTGPTHPGNLNATPAIVHSAVMYVLRLLVGEGLPLNEGLMTCVDLRIPRGLLRPDFGVDAATAPAVVGGNTETSQRIVEVLLTALGICAASQGTMNNVLMGTSTFGYYETIGGGVGADDATDGASAVHSHMTNTRITDAEVMERRYPVVVERFAIRRGSGGRGRHEGGSGIIRTIRFREPMSLSVLTQHRIDGPPGLAGGESGAPGRQWIDRADGVRIDLDPIAGEEVGAGDRLTIETPGGGGYGEP